MPKARKSNLAAPLGAAILILAVIGAVFLISSVWKAVDRALDNSSQKTELEELLYPVLMFDPIPFESVDTADPVTLLQSSIWAAVLSDTGDKYSIELGETLVVPTTDVNAAAVRLFGPDVELVHQTFGELDQNYYYNTLDEAYHIPLYTQVGYYIPRITEIEKVSDAQFSLTVGYVAPGNGVLVAYETESSEPDKYMIYDMSYNKEKKQYHITALRSAPSDTEASENN